MLTLRPYQRATIDALYAWFNGNATGHPVVVLPTGAGKSIIVAALVQEALQAWPETRILMLTHSKELIEQNHDKMLEVWPDAPIGIYSASIGRKELAEPITFAGIQSIRKHASKLGHVDLVIIDECHLLNNNEVGAYRKFIGELEEINPHIRVIGLTATPYRLGQGYLHEGDDSLFTDMIDPTSIEQLVHDGYLAPLRSKHTMGQIDVSGVHKQGGEYNAGELEDAAMRKNAEIVAETSTRAAHCKSVLVFAAGVAHAEALAEMFKGKCITGATQKGEREQIISDFKAGKFKYLTNANVLTTGFNHPDLDCIVLARPTMSPGLYVQMAGRGMRLKSHTDHCLVLDFAGAVSQHGPVTCVIPPSKKGGKPGDAPVKTCPNDACMELVHISVMVCPACGYEWPKPEPGKPKLHNDDIMGIEPLEMDLTAWTWSTHVSAQSGKEMLKIRYYGGLSDPTVTEYLPVTHDGYAGDKARGLLAKMANEANAPSLPDSLALVVDVMNFAKHPAKIQYKRDGKFYRVMGRSWDV